MRDGTARQLLAELARRRPVIADSQRNAAADAATLLRSFFYPKQGAFFTSPAKRKATSKTRRAGATTGGCIELLARAIERPGFRATIVHSTRVEARQRAWLSDTQSGLVDVLRRYGTPVDHPSIEVLMIGGVRADIRDQAMTIDFSNGSRIDLFGFDDERAMRKQRGLAKHVYWIDEAQDIRFLEGFYNKVVMAALDDYGGECWLSGTPGQDCSGMFYEITKDEDDGPRAAAWATWEVHSIAQVDNPFFGHVVADSSGGWLTYYVEDNLTKDTGVRHGPYATYAAAEKAAGTVRWDRTAGAALIAKGWKGDEPDFIREYLGKWSKQDARFVYPVHSVSPHDLLYAVQRPRAPDKCVELKPRVVITNYADHINPVTGLPADWCDFEKAISDLPKRKKFNQRRQWMYAIGADFGYNPDPMAIVVWAFAHDTQDVYELFSWKATKVHTDDQGLYLSKVWHELDNVVVLVGDPAGKQDDFEVWRTRLQLPIDEANKKGKNTLEEFLADDIRRGRVHLRRDSPLHDEMKNLVYLPTKIGKTREVAKYRRSGDGIIHGDHCLVAGTVVTTEHGEQPIEQVRVGTRVLTRAGWKPVLRAWKTGSYPTWRLTADDGREIVGTAGHPVWAENAWQPLASLTPGDTLITCFTRSLYLTAGDTAGTRGTKTDRCASTFAAPPKSEDDLSSHICTATCGRPCTAPYRTGITSIIETRTRSTMTSRISRWLRALNILASTPVRRDALSYRDAISSLLESMQRSGTLQRQVTRGTLNTGVKLWRHVRSRISNVGDVLRGFSPRTPMPSFAATPAGLQLAAIAESTTRTGCARSAPAHSGVIATPGAFAAHTRVLRVEPTGKVEDVYNLTVADQPEFFANGILTHNCADAARYAYAALTHYLSKVPADKADKGTPEAYAEEAARLEKQIDDREAKRAARMADGDEDYLDSIGGIYE